MQDPDEFDKWVQGLAAQAPPAKPEEYTVAPPPSREEQTTQWLKDTFGQTPLNIAETGQQFVHKAVTSFGEGIADLPDWLGTASKYAGEVLGADENNSVTTGLRWLAGKVRAGAEAVAPQAVGEHPDSFIGDIAGEAVGSGLSFAIPIATEVKLFQKILGIGKTAAEVAKIGRIAATAGTAIEGGMQQAESERKQAAATGATPQQEKSLWFGNFPIGMLEAFGVEGKLGRAFAILERVNKQTGGALGRGVLKMAEEIGPKIAKGAALGAAEEIPQELTSTALSWLLAANIHPHEVPLIQEMGRAFKGSSIAGVLFGGAAGMFGGGESETGAGEPPPAQEPFHEPLQPKAPGTASPVAPGSTTTPPPGPGVQGQQAPTGEAVVGGQAPPAAAAAQAKALVDQQFAAAPAPKSGHELELDAAVAELDRRRADEEVLGEVIGTEGEAAPASDRMEAGAQAGTPPPKPAPRIDSLTKPSIQNDLTEDEKPVSYDKVLRAAKDLLKATDKNARLLFGTFSRERRKLMKKGMELKGFYNAYRKRAGIAVGGSGNLQVHKRGALPTIAHEIGHAIDTSLLDGALFGTFDLSNKARAAHLDPRLPNWRVDPEMHANNVTKEVATDLWNLGDSLYHGRIPSGTSMMGEGFAELILAHIVNPTELKAQYPHAAAWLENHVMPKNADVANALGELQSRFQRYQRQGSIHRGDTLIVDPGKMSERIGRISWASTFGKLYRAWVESGAALERAQKMAQEMGHDQLSPNTDIFSRFRHFRGKAGAIVNAMVRQEMVRFDGTGLGEGTELEAIRPFIKGKYRQFLRVLLARRRLALAEKDKMLMLLGQRDSIRDIGLSVADAQEIMLREGTPEMIQATDMVYQWWGGVLQYLSDASVVGKYTVEDVLKEDAGMYIPLQRMLDEEEESLAKARKQYGVGGMFRRLGESQRPIKDPLVQLVQNARVTINAAHALHVKEQLVKLSALPGMGHVAQVIETGLTPNHNPKIKQIADKLAKLTGLPEAAALAPDLLQLADALRGAGTSFKEQMRGVGINPFVVIPIKQMDKNGNVVTRNITLAVEPDMVVALEQLDPQEIKGVLALMGSIPAKLGKMGFTTFSASFGLVRNPLRDVFSMIFNTQANKTGGFMFGEYLRSFAESFAHAVSAGKFTTPEIKMYHRFGITGAQSIGSEYGSARYATQRIGKSTLYRTISPRAILDYYVGLVQFPEMAPRLTELKRMRKMLGVSLAQGAPTHISTRAKMGNAASGLTVDFTGSGPMSRIANQFIPFFNAAIQGPRSHYESFRRNPRLFMLKAASMLSASIALWYLTKDDDWYKEMDDHERFSFWHIPLGDGTVLRIPRPFELGGLFAAMPTAFLDAWYDEDPEHATAWAKQFVEAVFPDVIPQVARVPIQIGFNKDFFSGRPIVPRGQEDMPKEEQVGPHTSEAAIWLGQQFGASPRVIDYAMRGTLGTMWTDIITATGLGPPQKLGLSGLPLFGSLFYRTEPGPGGRTVSRLYDLYGEAATASRSKANPQSKRDHQRFLMLQDTARAISGLSYAQASATDPADKRKIGRKITELAARAIAQAESGSTSRAASSAERKKATALKKKAMAPAK